MKHLIPTCMIALASLLACGEKESVATFKYFSYEGSDPTFALPADEANAYRNPILSGFYPDPSITRKGNDYFLATSSFAYYPGIPLFHSTDLVHWTPIGHALNRPSQLAIDNVRLSGGVYAPTIRYNEQNDTFYLINTSVGGIGNFIIKTKNPLDGNWSDPIPLKFGGIDPDLFFDDDGKAYIVHNDEPPHNKPLWNGHRAIWMRQFSLEGDSIFGEKLLVVDGGVDRTQHPVWIEAPHLYKINGYYYLMCAEGGTSVQHSEVIFRSDRVTGPYRPAPHNPILTQRDLPADRPDPITCAGHADLIQTPEGDWHAVFLACRPYEGGHYNTGRETFMLPVEWVNEYPVILPKGEAIPYVVPTRHPLTPTGGEQGNFAYRDDFRDATLNHRWLMIRTPRQEIYSLSPSGLRLFPNGHSLYEQDHPSFVAVRQQHLHFEAQTELRYRPTAAGDLAGLALFQNEKHNFIFGKTINDEGQTCLVLDEARGGEVFRLASFPLSSNDCRKPLTLKVTGQAARYAFAASLNGGKDWLPVFDHADGTILSTQTAGGFTGAVIGLYITEQNK